MSNPRYKIVIAQYHSGVGAHGVRPYQWHLCIETGRDARGFAQATAFFIRGSSVGGFALEYRENARYKMPHAYRGSVVVGDIPTSGYTLAVELMREVVTHDTSACAPQSWAYAAARKLSAHGVMPQELWAKDYVQTQLRYAEAAWERGDD